MDWYVIQAYSGYEQKVKIALEEKIELNKLSDKFGEILIPTEQIVELKGGSKKTTERKFFPGYIPIQIVTGIRIVLCLWRPIVRDILQRNFSCSDTSKKSSA